MADLLAFVLTSSVLGMLGSQWIEICRQRERDRREARVRALETAAALEEYTLLCAAGVEEDSNYTASEGDCGKRLASVPSPPRLEINAGFLETAGVADGIITLRQVAAQADDSASFWWRYVGDEEACRVSARESTAKLAIESYKLAAALRKAFKLPSRKLVFGEYDVMAVLTEEVPTAS